MVVRLALLVAFAAVAGVASAGRLRHAEPVPLTKYIADEFHVAHDEPSDTIETRPGALNATQNATVQSEEDKAEEAMKEDGKEPEPTEAEKKKAEEDDKQAEEEGAKKAKKEKEKRNRQIEEKKKAEEGVKAKEAAEEKKKAAAKEKEQDAKKAEEEEDKAEEAKQALEEKIKAAVKAKKAEEQKKAEAAAEKAQEEKEKAAKKAKEKEEAAKKADEEDDKAEAAKKKEEEALKAKEAAAEEAVKQGSHMVVVGNLAFRSTRWGGAKLNACIKNKETLGPATNRWGNKMGVACCKDATSNRGSRPGCKRAATYEAAEAHCKKHNMQLCSVKQIEAGAARGSGCSFDAYHEWTRDGCGTKEDDDEAEEKGDDDADTGKHLLVNGDAKRKNAHKNPDVCAPDSSKDAPQSNGNKKPIGVACCGNDDANKGDRKGCHKAKTWAEANTICKGRGMTLCSAQQIENKAAAHSGCGFDGNLQWTRDSCGDVDEDKKEGGKHVLVVGRVNGWRTNGSGNKPNVCMDDAAVTGPNKNSHGNKIGVACCNNEKDPRGDRQGCHKAKTFDEAEKICKANNKVLCSVKQIEAGAAAGSGCSFDAYHEWTRDSCGSPDDDEKTPDNADADTGKHTVVVGNVRGWRSHRTGKKPNRCVADKDTDGPDTNKYGKKLAVACCKDEDSIKGSRPGCKKSATYQEAKDHCKAHSMVLCSAEQIEKGAARGSGCSFDAWQQWTRDACNDKAPANPKDGAKHIIMVGNQHYKDHSSGKKLPVCVDNDAVEGPTKNRWGKKIGVVCCDDEGSLKGSRTPCMSAKTYEEAKQICSGRGKVLCSDKQIEGGAGRGSGCSFDAYHEWTRTTC